MPAGVQVREAAVDGLDEHLGEAVAVGVSGTEAGHERVAERRTPAWKLAERADTKPVHAAALMDEQRRAGAHERRAEAPLLNAGQRRALRRAARPEPRPEEIGRERGARRGHGPTRDLG